MLNPFPSLLIYGFFVPTLFRLTATIVLLIGLQQIWRVRTSATSITAPVIGRIRPWMLWLGMCILLADAFFLFVGLETQWAAIVAALAALKWALLPGRYDTLRPISRAAAWLFLVVCISLLFSGAGALAFDLPL
jgi:hypothetical protein